MVNSYGASIIRKLKIKTFAKVYVVNGLSIPNPMIYSFTCIPIDLPLSLLGKSTRKNLCKNPYGHFQVRDKISYILLGQVKSRIFFEIRNKKFDFI